MSTNNSILTRVFTQNMLRDLMYFQVDAPILSNIVKRYEIKYDGESKNENIIGVKQFERLKFRRKRSH